MTTEAMRRPIPVLGTISPYPTVVNVTMLHHNESLNENPSKSEIPPAPNNTMTRVAKDT